MFKQIKNNLYMFKFLFSYSKRFVIISLLIGLLSLYDSLISIYLIRYIINSIIDVNTNFKNVLLIIFLSCLMNVIISLINSWYNNKYLPGTRMEFRTYLNEKLYLRSLDIELCNFDNPEFYNDFTFVINDAENRVFAVYNAIQNFITNIAKFLLALTTIVLVFTDAIIVIFPILTLITTTLLFRNVHRQLFIRNQENLPLEREMEYIKRVFYLREFAKTLKLSDIKNVLIRNFMDSTEKSKNLFTKFSSKITFINFFLTAIFEIFNRFGLLAYLFWRAFTGIISIGDFSGLYNAANNLLTSLQGITQITKDIYENNLYIEKFREFYDEKNYSLIQGKLFLDLCNTKDFNIYFKNVSFKYNLENKNILKNISFSCKAGEKIAIIGHNGAGKSTLINLLLRLYHVSSGAIYINNTNIDLYDFNTYKKNFGVVSQDFNVFAASIGENVTLDITKTDDCMNILNALKIVGLYDEVIEMKDGLWTMLTKEFDSNGAMLSGGQMQKLALARLFVKNTPILVLDEPSSALDPVSEYQIFKQIFDRYKEKTIFFVSHRLYTAALADKIIVLDNGEIVEMGTHDILLEQNGKYAELYKASTENYKIKNDY